MSDQSATQPVPDTVTKVTAREINFSDTPNFKYIERIPAGNIRTLEADQPVELEDGTVVDAKAGDRLAINARNELRHFSKNHWNAFFEVDGSDANFFRRREGGQLKRVKEPTLFIAEDGKETLVQPGGGFFLSYADHKVTPFQADEIAQWFARWFYKSDTTIACSESLIKQTAVAAQTKDAAHLKDLSEISGVTDAFEATKDLASRAGAGLRQGLGQLRQSAAASDTAQLFKEGMGKAGTEFRKGAELASKELGDMTDKALAAAGEKGRELSQKARERLSRWFGGGKGPGSSDPSAPA